MQQVVGQLVGRISRMLLEAEPCRVLLEEERRAGDLGLVVEGRAERVEYLTSAIGE